MALAMANTGSGPVMSSFHHRHNTTIHPPAKTTHSSAHSRSGFAGTGLFLPPISRPTRQRNTGPLCPSAVSASEFLSEATQSMAATTSTLDGFGNTAFAVLGGGAIATLAATLSLADPEMRRKQQAQQAGGDDKDVVRNYFNTSGFERWRRIYGETDDVNSVQLDIREGHAQTVEKVLEIIKRNGSLEGITVCDAGCGTGSLAIPLAMQGAIVSASDISSAMVAEAERKANEIMPVSNGEASVGTTIKKPRFETRDLESLDGKYHTVACLDVLIHYPQDKAAGMIAHLASLADQRLILSFAPKTLYYSILKRIGELFPGPSKATRAYLHSEEDVEAALKAAGWVVRCRDMTATKFYFSRVLEAVPAGSQ